MGILLRLDECTELIKWDEGCDYTLLSEGSLGGISFSESEALAIANALYDDLGLGWLPYPENKPEEGYYNITIKHVTNDGEIRVYTSYGHYINGIDKGFWLSTKDESVIAFRPLPQPYGGDK